MTSNYLKPVKNNFNTKVACYMKVNTDKKDKPMLGVYKVYSVASGNLTLPYSVKK